MAPVPAAILNKLRSITFAFLWGSNGNSRRYHLVSWFDLSWPKKYEGWGIKNFFWSSIALRLKKFWDVLFCDSLWNQVLSAKYLKGDSVVTWLRGKHFSTRGVSIIWRGFLQVIPWMGKQLSWQVGNGIDIKIGIDPIYGIPESLHFSEGLRH